MVITETEKADTTEIMSTICLIMHTETQEKGRPDDAAQLFTTEYELIAIFPSSAILIYILYCLHTYLSIVLYIRFLHTSCLYFHIPDKLNKMSIFYIIYKALLHNTFIFSQRS